MSEIATFALAVVAGGWLLGLLVGTLLRALRR